VNKAFKTQISLMLIISLSSCIAFRANNYPEIKTEELKISSKAKYKVFIETDFHSSIRRHNNKITMDVTRFVHKKMLREVIKDSECCELTKNKNEANLIIKSDFYNDASNLASVLIELDSIFLFIIPSWINAESRISVEVKKGQVTKRYALEDSTLIAYWLPFLLVMPFKQKAEETENAMNKNLYKNLLIWMKEDKIL
jgi:hypothetical protein